eukprot:CAMPEP_0201250444 /NCGR_PEP_ID=MMETSP0852-20130820/63618_1 /ASSEMBLY_ACC=CAM_ASM_000632 /TAXON_ID=183588 /ORGANISM="Pseudo-nitzschia fraudulenta, Strain WWA7" /LENGTH=54 /DNA_ID=CAMNT_0047549797 /DNA_START=172 /DNA_END=333 /DNA_ORIENTATION=+
MPTARWAVLRDDDEDIGTNRHEDKHNGDDIVAALLAFTGSQQTAPIATTTATTT